MCEVWFVRYVISLDFLGTFLGLRADTVVLLWTYIRTLVYFVSGFVYTYILFTLHLVSFSHS